MDKNTIKNHLTKRFVTESATPGITVTDAAKKKSGEINKSAVKAVAKDSLDYNKSLKQDSDTSKMATNKYNYVDDAEKIYHDEMEILNGQEMIEYASEPGSEFKKRAEEGIVGSSRMGNEGKIGNAEETWGASSDNFGKDLVKRVKDSSKKRADAEIQTYGMGDVQIPTGNKVQVATTAMGAGKPKGDTTKASQSASEKSKIKVVKENNNNNQTKESMKRLKFNKQFEGINTTQKIGHALTLIPEHYKVDKKEVEITDGNVTFRARWEGTLNEGKAIVISAENKSLVNEDIARMKALFGYKSEDTLGTVKGKARINENVAFADIWKKSKALLGESEEIEGQTAEKEAPFEEADTKQAPEAKKHVEGSVSTDKGTQAPKPKTGEWEKNVKGQAAEAKKHVEGSVSTDKGTQAPKPKTGELDDAVNVAPEATKHMESGTATHKVTNTAKVVKETEKKGVKLGENYFEPMSENEEESEEEEAIEPEESEEELDAKADAQGEEEEEDSFYKPEADDTDDEKEPEIKDIAGDIPEPVAVPTKISGFMSSASNPGKLWIKIGLGIKEVPEKYMSIATSGNPKAALIVKDKMEVDASGEPEISDENGEENEM